MFQNAKSFDKEPDYSQIRIKNNGLIQVSIVLKSLVSLHFSEIRWESFVSFRV